MKYVFSYANIRSQLAHLVKLERIDESTHGPIEFDLAHFRLPTPRDPKRTINIPAPELRGFAPAAEIDMAAVLCPDKGYRVRFGLRLLEKYVYWSSDDTIDASQIFMVNSCGEAVKLIVTKADLGEHQFKRGELSEDWEKVDGGMVTWSIGIPYSKDHPKGRTFLQHYESSLVRLHFKLEKVPLYIILQFDVKERVRRILSGNLLSLKYDDDGNPIWSENATVKHVQDRIRNRTADDSLVLVTCNGYDETILKDGQPREFRILKSLLIAASPVLAACFNNQHWQQATSNTYDFGNTSPAAVEAMLLYFECGQVSLPDLQHNEVFLEVAKLATVYDVPHLLQVCELLALGTLADIDAPLTSDRWDLFFKICDVASIVDLPLAMVMIHYALKSMQDTFDVDDEAGTKWEQFVGDHPHFEVSRRKAFANMKKDAVDPPKKRKLDELLEDHDE